MFFASLSGRLPESIFVGLIETEAFVGKYAKSIHNYQDFGLAEVALRVTGDYTQNMVTQYSFKGSDATGVDDYCMGLYGAMNATERKDLGNGVNFLNFTNGE